MRDVRALAVAAVMAASAAPAYAATAKDKGDCEQVKNPGLKISACTRMLAGGGLPADVRSFAHHHRGLGLLLKQDYDRALSR